ncbi:pectate lyase [Marinicellulosiphila megalodicopiae]|uniref:pectate lyase n=1 Tax=Marinicellulosiphila megalodicopiae TaxID=2724896 RepID=UPI003BB0701C
MYFKKIILTEPKFIFSALVASMSLVACDPVANTDDKNPSSNNLPVANFIIETGTTDREKVLNAANSFDTDGDALSYIWDFGDGTNQITETNSITHTFAPGIYSVGLTITDGKGSSEKIQKSVTITNISPEVQFSNIQTQALSAELEIEFSDSDGDQVSVEWFVNDQSVATSQTLNYDFSQAGQYTIKVVVTDQYGETDETQTSVTVQDENSTAQKPTAEFSVTAGANDREKLFNASASKDEDGSDLTYIWNFGDGDFKTTSAPNISHIFAPGEFTVLLTVMNQSVSSNAFTASIVIENNAPTINLSTAIITALNVKIDATINDADSDALDVKWMLGSQEISNSQNLDYTFSTDGTFEIIAMVTDEFGKTNQTNTTVTVATSQPDNAAPTANFTYEINENQVSFTNTSTDPDMDPLTYSWDFKNGQTSDQTNPVISFMPGEYNVQLTVSDNDHTVPISKNIVINEIVLPVNAFKVEAESYSNNSAAVMLENSNTTVGYFNGDDYLVYDDVDLTEIQSVTVNYAANLADVEQTGFLEIRIDGLDGLLIALIKMDSTGTWINYSDKTMDLLVDATGIHDLYVIAVQKEQDYVANLDYFEFNIHSNNSVGNSIFNLDENSTGQCVLNGTIDSNHAGATGSSNEFINTDNSIGATVSWSINVTQVGVYDTQVRFANGGDTARSGTITVNQTGEQYVLLDATGAWDSWATENVKLALESGNNLITFKATTAGGLANIDKLSLTGDGLNDAECPEIEVPPTPTGEYLSQSGNPVHSRFNKYATMWDQSLADRILTYQYDSGGWGKNIDYNSVGNGSVGGGVGSTIDNGATMPEMTFMANVYKTGGNTKYRDAARKAMDYLLEAQYDSGGWPQFYPLKGGYADHVTYNDNAMSAVLTVLDHAVKQTAPFDTDVFSDADRAQMQIAINKGVDYILKSQWKQNGKLTVWCAQHGATDYLPKDARAYELASLSGSESTEIVAFLMTQPQTPEIQASIQAAVDWFSSPNTYLADHKYDKAVEEKIVASSGDKMWYRFYNLQTNVGFFSDRDGGTYYDIMDISEERRNGYSWGGSYGTKIINYAQSVGFN